MNDTLNTATPLVCVGAFHAYPTVWIGDPQYAQDGLNRCLCGKKRKVTTVEEVDVVAKSKAGRYE